MNHFEILREYGIQAKKSLGQNFLINDTLLESIADTLPIREHDIIEIGPGYGALTEKILRRNPKSLTLVELDQKMISILESRIKKGDLNPSGTSFSILHQDVLKYVPESEGYTVIANIPYYITSPILFRFLLELEKKPSDMLILMQKEVGEKIKKRHGYGNSYLSLAMEFSCEEIAEVLSVAKGNFVPPPKVESSVLHFKRRNSFNPIEAQKFLQIVSAGFITPRKKLISNLSGKLGVPKEEFVAIFRTLGWPETIRAEEVDLEGWKKLIGFLE